MEKITKWLKNRRIKSNLDVRELAGLSFVSISQISRIENNISDITVNALVGLGYGLDFGLDEVLGELKIFPYFPRTKNRKQSSALIPKTEDAYAIWLLFRDEPQKAKGLMYDGYRQVEVTVANENTNEVPQSFDTVWEAIQAHSDLFVPLPYPTGMDTNHFADIYSRVEPSQTVTWERVSYKKDLKWGYPNASWRRRRKCRTAFYRDWKGDSSNGCISNMRFGSTRSCTWTANSLPSPGKRGNTSLASR